jgi:hypothetical protein
MKKIKDNTKCSKEDLWQCRETVSNQAITIIEGIEKLPNDVDRKQKNFYKDNRIMERIMERICDDVKEAKEVKKEADEIIKEVARKAESPWKTEYFEDKNDPYEYKIGYCSLGNGVCVENRCWPYRGFTIDWIEDIRMLFWRLEHPDTWWCDFDRVFKTVDEDKEKVLKRENEEKITQELNAIDIYRKRIGDEFEKELTEVKEKLEQVKNECREIVEYLH